MKSRDVFRERVRALAGQSGTTPSAMAQELGHSSSWISQLFSGRRGSFFATIDEIAAYLKVPPAVLFGGNGRWIDDARTTADSQAIAETKGDEDATDVAGRGGRMADDLGQSLLTTLGLVPVDEREEFVTHCFQTAMTWRTRARHAATGTEHPKA